MKTQADLYRLVDLPEPKVSNWNTVIDFGVIVETENLDRVQLNCIENCLVVIKNFGKSTSVNEIQQVNNSIAEIQLLQELSEESIGGHDAEARIWFDLFRELRFCVRPIPRYVDLTMKAYVAKISQFVFDDLFVSHSNNPTPQIS